MQSDGSTNIYVMERPIGFYAFRALSLIFVVVLVYYAGLDENGNHLISVCFLVDTVKERVDVLWLARVLPVMSKSFLPFVA